MNNWYSDALKYANRLATNSGGWKEGEQEEVKKVLSFIGGMHDKATEDSEEDSLYNVFESCCFLPVSVDRNRMLIYCFYQQKQ